MAAVFHLANHERWTEIVFDDGGMNVLSTGDRRVCGYNF